MGLLDPDREHVYSSDVSQGTTRGSDSAGNSFLNQNEEILSENLEIENGYLTMPGGPGLGIKINEAVIEKYPFIPGPWSFFHQDSPKTSIAVTGDHSVKWVKH